MQTRLMLTIDDETFWWLDKAAKKAGQTKSELFVRLTDHFRGIPPLKEKLTVKGALESWRAFLPDPEEETS